jgi:integral membrane sensor domain MASE1
MKALFVLLVLSTVAVLVAAVAMWWRLRRHLRRSDEALKNALKDIEQAHDPVQHS